MTIVAKLINRLRGRPSLDDELSSLSLRAEYRARGVEIGLYSYGCFDLGRVPAGVTVGRYCSFAPTAQIFLRNHGIGFLGLTAYLYNEALGVVDSNKIAHRPLHIGDDVWLGHNSVILSQVAHIGRGAAVAAGAVVTRDVPAYAVVAGNPARVIRMRFDEATIAAIEQTRWWELDPAELRKLVQDRPEMAFDPGTYFQGRPFD